MPTTKDLSVNEIAPPSANRKGPRVPKHDRWLDLDAYGYVDFRIRIWSNPPQRLLLEIDSGDGERITAAWKQVFLEHNDWCDSDGEAMVAADAPGFLDALPQELLGILLYATRQAWLTLPTLPTRINGRSASG